MNTSFPSLPEQAKNLAKFSIEVVKNAVNVTSPPVLMTKEQQKQRLDICNQCEYYRMKRCMHCGCFMENKVKFTISKCPIGKW
jgi:hypothetical protein